MQFTILGPTDTKEIPGFVNSSTSKCSSCCSLFSVGSCRAVLQGTGTPAFSSGANRCFPRMSARGGGWWERCSITSKSFFHRKPYKSSTGALTSSLLTENRGTSNILCMNARAFQVLGTTFSGFELCLNYYFFYPMQVFHCLNEILDLCHSFCSLVSQNLGPLDERGAAQLGILMKVNLCLSRSVLLPCKPLLKQSCWF